MSDQEEQWIVVTKKHKGINKEGKKKKKGTIVWEMGKPIYQVENQEEDIEIFRQSSAFKENGQILSGFFQEYRSQMANYGVTEIRIRIECVGLGNFIQYLKPRLQFYMLKFLLQPICQKYSDSQVVVNCYDPVFTPQCIQEAQKIGTCQNTWEEKQLSHQEDKKELILYFMPHCQRFMYEKVCQNFSQKREGERAFNALILGNSLIQYIERLSLIQEQIPPLLLATTRTVGYQEKKLKDYRESLNDTYLYFI